MKSRLQKVLKHNKNPEENKCKKKLKTYLEDAEKMLEKVSNNALTICVKINIKKLGKMILLEEIIIKIFSELKKPHMKLQAILFD